MLSQSINNQIKAGLGWASGWGAGEGGDLPSGPPLPPPPYSSADPGSRCLARQEGVCAGGQARQTAAGRAAAPRSCTLPTSS